MHLRATLWVVYLAAVRTASVMARAWMAMNASTRCAWLAIATALLGAVPRHGMAAVAGARGQEGGERRRHHG